MLSNNLTINTLKDGGIIIISYVVSLKSNAEIYIPFSVFSSICTLQAAI
jgi:hypothetical protein